jgi:uncharacterized tellurite resistance protein B-like protein
MDGRTWFWLIVIAIVVHWCWRNLRAAPKKAAAGRGKRKVDTDSALLRAVREAEADSADEVQQRAALPAGVEPKFEPNRPLPPGMQAVLPPADPEDNHYAEGQIYGKAVGRTVIIDYCDAAGNETRRQVTVKQVIGEGESAEIFCWCHHRRALRTFLFARIQAMYRADTGEVIARPLDFLMGAAQGIEGEAFSLFYDDVIVLVYLAKADLRMVQKERSAIIDYLVSVYHSPDKLDKKVLDTEIKGYAPDLGMFRGALRALRGVPDEHKAALLAAAEAVIMADGRRHESEEDALGSLRRALGVDGPKKRSRAKAADAHTSAP